MTKGEGDSDFMFWGVELAYMRKQFIKALQKMMKDND